MIVSSGVSDQAFRESPGKRMPSAQYLHVSALGSAHPELIHVYERGLKVLREDADIDGREATVLKFHRDAPRISFLWLGSPFEAEGHPEILLAIQVDVKAGSLSTKNYTESVNPPVIHRRELMVARDHPRWEEFRRFTLQEEAAGLFDKPPPGFRTQWGELLREKGYRVVGNRLFKVR